MIPCIVVYVLCGNTPTCSLLRTCHESCPLKKIIKDLFFYLFFFLMSFFPFLFLFLFSDWNRSSFSTFSSFPYLFFKSFFFFFTHFKLFIYCCLLIFFESLRIEFFLFFFLYFVFLLSFRIRRFYFNRYLW